MLVGEFCQREYSLKTVAAATSLGIQCTPNWRMRKLDLATIGLYEKSFIFWGGCSGIGVLQLSEGREGEAMPCTRPRRSSWRDGHARPAIHPETCPPTGETREKTSSHLRSREDKRFHSTPARNAADNVARVRVAHLPPTAGTSRVPQPGGAAVSACSIVARGRHPAKSAAGRREVSLEDLS